MADVARSAVRTRDRRKTRVASDATADANDDVGPLLFELAPAAELGKDLFLRLFAHGTGVKQQHIRFRRVISEGKAMTGRKHVRNAGGVVLVHLAAKGFDVELAVLDQSGG